MAIQTIMANTEITTATRLGRTRRNQMDGSNTHVIKIPPGLSAAFLTSHKGPGRTLLSGTPVLVSTKRMVKDKDTADTHAVSRTQSARSRYRLFNICPIVLSL
jgi:hypothetical protein